MVSTPLLDCLQLVTKETQCHNEKEEEDPVSSKG